jgi:predicted DNA-binding protein with PD1-like motif
MKVITRTDATVILRLDAGENAIESLKDFCTEEDIHAASFTALGSTTDVELAYYDLTSKSYLARTFTELLEIATIVGTVSIAEGEIVVHAHGVFSDRKMATKAGHVTRMVVGATCEMTLTVLPGALEREHSEEIGLKLLK